MPIYEYRCECGKHMDVLVRGGREPTTCDEAGEASNYCMKEGRLTRAVTAAGLVIAGLVAALPPPATFVRTCR